MTLIATWEIDDGKVRPRRSNVMFGRDRVLFKIRQRIARGLRADGLSFPQIGQRLGGRHHATIMYMLGLLKRQRATP